MGEYTKNYLYIYSTQVLSMLLGMLSLFIVTPFLSSNKELYGIYAICSSLTLFYNYADIGFLGAGQKFASEAYIREEQKRELKILGFSGMIFLLFLLILSAIILIIAINPSILIKDISEENVPMARSLLLILALSSPIVCFQRIGQMLYSVRLSDYYYQLMQLVGSLLKILSVFLFFSDGHYNIIGYYLTYQLISAFIVVLAFVFLYSKYSISFLSVLKHFRLRRSEYLQLKDLAFASLFGTICWVLYYELDNVFISRLIGAEAVAIYAVAFSILTIFRNIFGSLFNPYQTRFNYFVGLWDYKGLYSFVKTIIEFFIPICLIPIIIMSIVSEPFVYSWVGSGYQESIPVLICLLFCNVLAFISYPSGLFITALQKTKHLYFINGIIVLVFWIGVLISYKQLGVVSFALMKAIGMILSAIYGFVIVFHIMKEPILKFVTRLTYVYFVPVACCVSFSILAKPYMRIEKGSSDLLVNICIIVLLGMLSFLSVLVVSSLHRNKIGQMLSLIKRKITSECGM